MVLPEAAVLGLSQLIKILKKKKTEIKTSVIYNTKVGINLTKYVKDLCTPNYKITDERIKEDLNKWRETLSS